MCIWGDCVTLYLLDAHLGNSTGRRTVTMTALLLTSGPVRYEAVPQSHGTSQVGGQVPTYDSAHSWRLYSAALLEQQAAGTMTCYPHSVS